MAVRLTEEGVQKMWMSLGPADRLLSRQPAAASQMNSDSIIFPFRPWVARAGLSIVLVATAITLLMAGACALWPTARYGWIGEKFVWVYIGTLWIGGLRIWLGSRRPVAVATPESLTLRVLHQWRVRTLPWEGIRGTEQMIGGDRLILYFDTPRGLRFVALNLNLVKGRREFLALLEQRLRGMDFQERVVERSRYLSRA